MADNLGYPIKYTGPEVDEILEKGKNLTPMENGWIRIPSTEAKPINLNDLKATGNYFVEYFTNGPESKTMSFINISNVNIGGNIYQFTATPTCYSRQLDVHTSIWTQWKLDDLGGMFNPSPVAPKNPVYYRTIWLDTSDRDHPALKLYTGQYKKEWILILPTEVMLKSIYDKNGLETDIYQYIDQKISDSTLDDLESAINNHINNASIHVTQVDKNKWNTAANMNDLNDALNEVMVALKAEITSESAGKQQLIDQLNAIITALQTTINSHVDDTTIHPDATKQAEWDSKAAGDHTHNLDDRVTIYPSQIDGVIPSSKLPYDVKERAYTIDSLDDLYTLTKNPVHNGDLIKVKSSSKDGKNPFHQYRSEGWYVVSDDSALLGETEVTTFVDAGTAAAEALQYSVDGAVMGSAADGLLIYGRSVTDTTHPVVYRYSSADDSFSAATITYGDGTLTGIGNHILAMDHADDTTVMLCLNETTGGLFTLVTNKPFEANMNITNGAQVISFSADEQALWNTYYAAHKTDIQNNSFKLASIAANKKADGTVEATLAFECKDKFATIFYYNGSTFTLLKTINYEKIQSPTSEDYKTMTVHNLSRALTIDSIKAVAMYNSNEFFVALDPYIIKYKTPVSPSTGRDYDGAEVVIGYKVASATITEVTIPVQLDGTDSTKDEMHIYPSSLIYDGEKLLAFMYGKNNGSKYMYSVDGLNWTEYFASDYYIPEDVDDNFYVANSYECMNEKAVYFKNTTDTTGMYLSVTGCWDSSYLAMNAIKYHYNNTPTDVFATGNIMPVSNTEDFFVANCNDYIVVIYRLQSATGGFNIFKRKIYTDFTKPFTRINNASTDITWDDIVGKPTTLEGYGITDAVEKSAVEDLFNKIPTNLDLNAYASIMAAYNNCDNDILQMGQIVGDLEEMYQILDEICS